MDKTNEKRLLTALNDCMSIKPLLDRGYYLQAKGEASRTDIYDNEADDCFDQVTQIISAARSILQEVTA